MTTYRFFRTLTPVLALAFAVTACSLPGSSTRQAAPAAPTTAPAVTAAPAPAPAPVSAEPKPAVVVPSTTAPAAPAAPTPAPVAPRQCTASKRADGGTYEVINISDTDPDGGLVVRYEPAHTSAGTAVIPEGSYVFTVTAAANCMKTSDGKIWWSVTSEFGDAGWVNAHYLDYPIDFHDGIDYEVDAHGDCLYLPAAPGDCIVVFYSGDEIVMIESDNQHLVSDLEEACYGGAAYEPACQALGFLSSGD